MEKLKMFTKKSNLKSTLNNKIKNLKKGINNMQLQNLNHLLIKSILILFVLLFSGKNLPAQFVKFYDYSAFSGSVTRPVSIEKVSSPADGWSVSGGTSSMGTKWFFQKMDASGSVIYTSLLGEPTPFGSQNCWSHTLLSSMPDNNVLAGVYKGGFMADEELFGEGAFTKLSSTGDPVITKRVAISPPFTVSTWRQVISDPVSNFILTGSQIFNPTPIMYIPKVIAAKYTPSGIMSWGYRYNLGSDLVDALGHSICFAGDASGDYYVTGQIYLGGPPPKPYVFILKLDASGIVIWAKAFLVPTTPTQYSNASKIISLPDGNVVVAGCTTANEPGHDYKDMWIFRVTSSGSMVWSKTYGIAGVDEEAMSLVYQSSDASLIVTGYKGTTSGHTNLNLSKVDALSGSMIWMKFYDNPSGYDRGMDIKQFSANRITGYVSFGTGTYQPAFIKTDLSGYAGGCLISTSLPDLSLNVMPQPLQFQYIPITDSLISYPVVHVMPGSTTCGLTEVNENQNNAPKQFSLEQNYPNPFNPSTNIKYNITEGSLVKLTVFNELGKQVDVLVDEYKNPGTYEIKFNAAKLSSGIYFYKLETNGFTDVKKMMLIK